MILLSLGGCAAPAAHSPHIVTTAPCFASSIDTGGWRETNLNVWPFALRLPPAFVSSAEPVEGHGGQSWNDGPRKFEAAPQVGPQSGRDPCESLPGARCCPGYSDCIDTLAGIPFRIATYYNEPAHGYAATAKPLVDDGRAHVMAGVSPDSTDLRLFLDIIRTLHRRQ